MFQLISIKENKEVLLLKIFKKKGVTEMTRGEMQESEVQVIKRLDEVKSPVFGFSSLKIRRLLFKAGVIKTSYNHRDDPVNFLYKEKNKKCPDYRIEEAVRFEDFLIFFQKTSKGTADGVCIVYSAG